MNNKLVNRVFINAVLTVVLMVCFSACGRDKKENVFLSEEHTESKSEVIEDNNNISDNHANDSKEVFESISSDETISKIIYVQVNGAVKNPGVYKIEKKMRVFEVIELAGGVTLEGASEAVNMARPVTDEMVIYIPTKEEVLEGFSEQTETIFEDYELDNTKKILVNINTASIDELMTLSGIGEIKAKQIIEYRKEKGAFKDISEIMNISGIKQSAFDKIKDYITV